MKRATKIRIAIIASGLVALEAACQFGLISRFFLIPPSKMFIGLIPILRGGLVTADLLDSLQAIAISAISAIIVGFVVGCMLYAVPRLRRVLNPILTAYYSIPMFVFYPLIIVFFGLNTGPKIVMGFLLAVVAMIINTLNGLDRVPNVQRKTAAVLRLSRWQTALLIILPSAARALFAGVKLAIAYAFLGVLGAEFILASTGIGYRIAYAFNSFDNTTMYSLIVLVLLMVTAVNSVLFACEKGFFARQGL